MGPEGREPSEDLPPLSTAAGPWFHGGIAGLDVGDELLPGLRGGEISVTHHFADAVAFAQAKSGGGDVYEIEIAGAHWGGVTVLGYLDRSTEDPSRYPWPPRMPVHFTTRRAAVVRVAARDLSQAMTRHGRRRAPIKRRKPDGS
jgi:hypothetical protein